MKKYIYTLSIVLTLLISWTGSFCQAPSGYYDDAYDLTGEELRTALFNIIKNHTSISYGSLWDAFEDTDKRSDGKVWDMYSNCNFTFGTNQCGNYRNVCDCYNREHSFPKSWFNDAMPMYSDLFHLYPTDGKTNGMRSNHPFGEVSSNSTTWGTGKVGSARSGLGYSGTVFEPADEFKGDFARSYFYMLTRYRDKISNWNSDMLSGNNFSIWAKEMLLDWHRDDPVSQKEINRNNAVYSYQHNRNPFIDNPEFADLIWDPNFQGDPVLNITSPANGTIVYSDNVQVIFQVRYFVLGVEGKVKYSLNDENVNYTTQTSININGLRENANNIKLELVDNNNNSLNPSVFAEVSVVYSVSIDDPALYIISPEDGAIVNADMVEVTFSVSNFIIEGSETEGKVEYSLNDIFIDYTSTSPVNISNLNDGSNKITLQLVDNSNNPLSPVVKKDLNIIYDELNFVSSYSTEDVIKIYPNPVNSSFEIESNSISEISSVFITDISGKVVYSDHNFSIDSNINLDDKTEGIYFVIVRLKNGETYSEKIALIK